jgi:hypothetical protein
LRVQFLLLPYILLIIVRGLLLLQCTRSLCILGVDMESMYTEVGASLYTQVGVYLLLVNTWRLPGLHMESTRSLQGVTITVFSINSVHGLPVQSH